MTRQTANVALCSILSTLNETPGGEAPEGHMYAAMMAGYTLQDFMTIKSILLKGELVTAHAGPVLRITEKGREIARQADAFVAQAKAAQS